MGCHWYTSVLGYTCLNPPLPSPPLPSPPLAHQPENILVQISASKDTVKLIDYGAARHTWAGEGDIPLHRDYEPTADYQYTPPEVFQAETLEPRSDIW